MGFFSFSCGARFWEKVSALTYETSEILELRHYNVNSLPMGKKSSVFKVKKRIKAEISNKNRDFWKTVC